MKMHEEKRRGKNPFFLAQKRPTAESRVFPNRKKIRKKKEFPLLLLPVPTSDGWQHSGHSERDFRTEIVVFVPFFRLLWGIEMFSYLANYLDKRFSNRGKKI